MEGSQDLKVEDLSQKLDILKKHYSEELVRKYLSGMEGLREASAGEMTQMMSRRFIEIMSGKKDELINDFISDLKLVGLSLNLELGDELTSRIVAIYEKALNDIMSSSIQAMADVVEDYFRWSKSNDTNLVSERIFGLIQEASEAMAKLDILEHEIRKRMSERFKNAIIQADRRYKALAILEQEGELSATELATKLGVVEGTARKYLDFLLGEGFVEKDFRTRPYVYRFISAPWTVRVSDEEG